MIGLTHPAIHTYAQEAISGSMSRREFLARATSLGASAATAYSLIGLSSPAAAQATRQMGGTLRIQQEVRALKDPRSYDWPQMSNVTRGWLEYLVEYQRDGTIAPMLLDAWTISNDASLYTLRLRPGVTWSNGDPFTAADVTFNITRWCDSTVDGNAMASRFSALIDRDTGQARADAIQVIDDLTVQLALSAPDISLIASFSDYPAAIVHPSFDGDPLNAIGTGPFRPTDYQVGIQAVIERNTDHSWWGTEVFGPATLDQITFLDFGTDQSAIFAAADSDEVDMVYESIGDFVDLLDTLDWTRTEAETTGTIVIRPNQQAQIGNQTPYADVRVRRALSMAVDNATLLELGYAGRGTVAANHHVSPIHPEYADIGAPIYDPEGARALMDEADMLGFEHELISLDDDWRRPTCDAMAAQLRDAGFAVKRTVLPGATFWNDWAKYPFSATDWGHRPLGVQVLGLAYRAGAAWNESGFANAEFDALLDEALGLADADQRRDVMGRIQTILQQEGVVTQPYWRSVYRHAKPNVLGAEMHPVFEIHTYKLGLAA